MPRLTLFYRVFLDNVRLIYIESKDAEFDDYERHFSSLETAAERMIKDIKAFCEAIVCKCIHASGENMELDHDTNSPL